MHCELALLSSRDTPFIHHGKHVHRSRWASHFTWPSCDVFNFFVTGGRDLKGTKTNPKNVSLGLDVGNMQLTSYIVAYRSPGL